MIECNFILLYFIPMEKLEELLKSLIEKGWKPFGRNYQRYEHWCLIREFTTEDGVYSYGQYPTTYREFCSKESWLWQFCTKNGMIKHEIYEDIHSWTFTTAEHSDFWYTSWDNYEYRIIQSALKDESELEGFLLSNIKIEW